MHSVVLYYYTRPIVGLLVAY